VREISVTGPLFLCFCIDSKTATTALLHLAVSFSAFSLGATQRPCDINTLSVHPYVQKHVWVVMSVKVLQSSFHRKDLRLAATMAYPGVCLWTAITTFTALIFSTERSREKVVTYCHAWQYRAIRGLKGDVRNRQSLVRHQDDFVHTICEQPTVRSWSPFYLCFASPCPNC
jgi:hypothetical protein